MEILSLRPLVDQDVDLLSTWLHQDYVRQWFQEPDDWLREIKGRHDSFAWIHHFIVMAGAVPIGFCQYYDCFNSGILEDWYNVTQPDDTFSIDYMIGNQAYLGHGYGKILVKLLTDTVWQHEAARRIIAQPDPENQASNKVLLANGYIFDPQKKYYYKMLG